MCPWAEWGYLCGLVKSLARADGLSLPNDVLDSPPAPPLSHTLQPTPPHRTARSDAPTCVLGARSPPLPPPPLAACPRTRASRRLSMEYARHYERHSVLLAFV